MLPRSTSNVVRVSSRLRRSSVMLKSSCNWSIDDIPSSTMQQQQQQQQHSYRVLSTSEATNTTNNSGKSSDVTPAGITPKEYTFHSPKVKDLFERIAATMTSADVQKVADTVNNMFGRPVRKNEFYYYSIGGVRSSGGGNKKGGTGSGEVDDDEAGAAAAATPAIKTHTDIKLTGYNADAKIKIIKEIRAIAGLGLKEAKDLVESAPKIIQKNIALADADTLKKKLEELGAQIELV